MLVMVLMWLFAAVGNEAVMGGHSMCDMYTGSALGLGNISDGAVGRRVLLLWAGDVAVLLWSLPEVNCYSSVGMDNLRISADGMR